MRLKSLLPLNGIAGSVGKNMKNDAEDVRQTRHNLKAVGMPADDDAQAQDGTESGFITHGLDTGLKRLQRKHGLREDGVMTPDGETAEAMEDELAQAQNDRRHKNNTPRHLPPKPGHKPETGMQQEALSQQDAPQPPASKTDFFDQRRPSGELREWQEATQDLPPTLQKTYRDIFAFEGGMATNRAEPDNPAKAGIRQSTLDSLIDRGRLQAIVDKHGQNPDVEELDKTDIKRAYDDVLNEAMRGPVTAQKQENERRMEQGQVPLPPKQGRDFLLEIDNSDVIAATADTLFRHGAANDKGPKYIQEAVNEALPDKQKISTQGGLGSQTLNALQDVADSPARRRAFLDALKQKRQEDENISESEVDSRLEHFRFPE